MGNKTRWIVTTTQERALDAISTDLAARGFQVDEVLDAIGTIIGSADETTARALTAVDGVSDVEPDAGIDIGPPGDDPTW